MNVCNTVCLMGRKGSCCARVGCRSLEALAEANPPWLMSLLWVSVESFRCVSIHLLTNEINCFFFSKKSLLFHFSVSLWNVKDKVRGVKQDVPPLSSCLQQSSHPLALSVSDIQSLLVCLHALQHAPKETNTKQLSLDIEGRYKDVWTCVHSFSAVHACTV